MSDAGKIEIRVVGQIGNEPLSPLNFDIREIKGLFDVVETLLYPNQKVGRAPITYALENGSVRNIFTTTLQSAATFLAIVSIVNQTGTLDGLEINTAKAFQEIQRSSLRNGYTYEFRDPDKDITALVISNETQYVINDNLWAEAEFYFYGTLVNAGGKDKTNIHLLTKDNGLIVIATEKEILQDRDDNVLYRQFMVRAKGRQNIVSGAIDFSTLQLLDMTPFNPKYNERYLSHLIKRATPKWSDIEDANQWLSEIRGTNG